MVRDWGYDDFASHGGRYDELICPEGVADYSKRDSKALSKVSDDDLVYELEVRLLENGSLPAESLYEKICKIGIKYRLHLKEY